MEVEVKVVVVLSIIKDKISIVIYCSREKDTLRWSDYHSRECFTSCQRGNVSIYENVKRKKNNYASLSKQADNKSEKLCVMQHMMNIIVMMYPMMRMYIDSNDFMGEWFIDIKNMDTLLTSK